MEPEPAPDYEVDDQTGPPPSYAIARELDALASMKNLFGLVFVLDGDKIKIRNTENNIYSLSLSPIEGKGTDFTFSLRTYQINKTDITGPKIASYRNIYSVQSWKSSNNQRIAPASYSISSEARSFYAYKPGCYIRQGDYSLLPLSILLRSFGVHKNLRSWRLCCHDSKADGNAETTEVTRKRKDRKSGEYEWMCSGDVLAIETVAASEEHIPTFEIKTETNNRRLIHAMVLSWALIIWHNTKIQHIKKEAAELANTLTWKQKLDMKIHGTWHSDVGMGGLYW